MKKVIPLILALILCITLCACDKGEDALLGAWYSDTEGIIIIFSESGNMRTCIVDCSYNANPTVGIHDEKYTLVAGAQLETYSTDGSLNVIYAYDINGDVLNLSLTSSDYSISLTKVKKSSTSKDLLLGEWRLLSMGYVESPSYQYWKYNVTFYSDGTFISKHRDYVTDDEITTNSRYTTIHNGSTIEMEFTTYSYWDYEFLSDDVMLVTTENSELLYIAQ